MPGSLQPCTHLQALLSSRLGSAFTFTCCCWWKPSLWGLAALHLRSKMPVNSAPRLRAALCDGDWKNVQISRVWIFLTCYNEIFACINFEEIFLEETEVPWEHDELHTSKYRSAWVLEADLMVIMDCRWLTPKLPNSALKSHHRNSVA